MNLRKNKLIIIVLAGLAALCFLIGGLTKHTHYPIPMYGDLAMEYYGEEPIDRFYSGIKSITYFTTLDLLVVEYTDGEQRNGEWVLWTEKVRIKNASEQTISFRVVDAEYWNEFEFGSK